MGDRGFHAGGYDYMTWHECRCGRKFIIGTHNAERQCMICRHGGDGTPKRLKRKGD